MRWYHQTVSLSIILAFSAPYPLSTALSVDIGEVEIIKRAVNLRKGPGLHFPRVRLGFLGQRYHLIGRSGRWLYIQINKVAFAWVREDMVRILGDKQEGLAEKYPTADTISREEIERSFNEFISNQEIVKKGDLEGLKKSIKEINERVERLEVLVDKLEQQDDEQRDEKTWKDLLHLAVEINYFTPGEGIGEEFGNGAQLGLGVNYELAKNLLLEIGASYFAKPRNDDENGEIRLKMIPLDLNLNLRSGEAFSPYFGGGMTLSALMLSKDIYKGDDAERRYNTLGYHLIGGIDVITMRMFTAGLKIKYSYQPLQIGDNHLNAGGLSIGLRVMY